MTAGTWIAVASMAKARRIAETLDRFRLAGATAPERARPLDALGVATGAEVDALALTGVLVHDVAAGGWWLDEAAWVAHRDRRQPRKAVRLLLGFVALLLFIVAIGMIVVVRQAREVGDVAPDPAPAATRRIP